MGRTTLIVWLISLVGGLMVALQTAQAEVVINVWGGDYVTANRALNLTSDLVVGDGATSRTVIGTGGPADITPTNADYIGPPIFGGFSASTLNVAPTVQFARVNFRATEIDQLQVRVDNLNFGTGADADGVLSGIQLFDFAAQGFVYRDLVGVQWDAGGNGQLGAEYRRTGLAMQIGGQLVVSELTNGFSETMAADQLASITFSAYSPADLGTGSGGGNVRDYSYAGATGVFDTLSNQGLADTLIEKIGWSFEVNSRFDSGNGRTHTELNTFTVTVPEPSSLLLLATAVGLGLCCLRRRCRPTVSAR